MELIQDTRVWTKGMYIADLVLRPSGRLAQPEPAAVDLRRRKVKLSHASSMGVD